MKRHWVIHPSSEEAKRIASEFNIHPAIASVILLRGLKKSPDIFSFLNPSLETLESPFAFSDMKKAVERIQSAIEHKEKILVYKAVFKPMWYSQKYGVLIGALRRPSPPPAPWLVSQWARQLGG